MQFFNTFRLGQVNFSEIVWNKVDTGIKETVPGLSSACAWSGIFKFFVGLFKVVNAVLLIEGFDNAFLNKLLLKLF